MDGEKKREKLEVSDESQQIRLERLFGIKENSGPPSIGPVSKSKVLDRAKLFMPKMVAAEATLKQRIDSGEEVSVEECKDDQPFIEMNVGIFQQKKKVLDDNEDEWSVDSDPDSLPSSDEQENDFTSDSDPDSSSECSSSTTSGSSSSSTTSPRRSPSPTLKMPGQQVNKRPIIEELSKNRSSGPPPQKKGK